MKNIPTQKNDQIKTIKNHIESKKSYQQIAANMYRGSTKYNKQSFQNKYNIDYDNVLDSEYEIIEAID